MSEAGRLRWRCRRGMRELDQLLGWYLETRYARATSGEQAAFVDLLEQPDPELWAWLSGEAQASTAEWRLIVAEIRKR
jgi:antitoxin CptB